MNNILGIDLGTNSIGICVRDPEKSTNITEQLDFFSTLIFPSGVGNGKSGEFSYAAQRTQRRSTRNLYKVRKYRIWSTLALLIEYKMCPLSFEELDQWRGYNKTKGLKRQYPLNAKRFEQWVRLDFNADGKRDYTSPYQLRKELVEIKYDFEKETDRFKLGRALYHIAQRRGFKSSKGETIKEQEIKDIDLETEEKIVPLKQSEENKAKNLTEYMEKHNCPTVGCAFAELEKEGRRIRNSEYQAVRSQYWDEIVSIFQFQGLNETHSDFCCRILSTKKGEGTIFYKRPLRTQKGLIGKCTLEPNKPRCPICHPDYEEFRAYSFINNIKYRKSCEEEWQTLNEGQRVALFKSKFMRTVNVFSFKEIREWLEKDTGYSFSYKIRNINYKDNTSVSACPVSAQFKKLFGENWKNVCIETGKERRGYKGLEFHKVVYRFEDIWHVCFTCDDEDFLLNFASNNLALDKEKSQRLIRIYESMRQGYANLSRKAINNILPFLRHGYIYSYAVLLAKIPEILGQERWVYVKNELIEKLRLLQQNVANERKINNIVNMLIANYKSLDFDERWAVHDYTYQLDESDCNDVLSGCIRSIGEKTWEELDKDVQKKIQDEVAKKYQAFFCDVERKYVKTPRIDEVLKDYLLNQFPDLNVKSLDKLYHPSSIEFYSHSATGELGSPVIGALKNPMAMRVLHCLRKQINSLLRKGVIDESTRVVIETARQLNDANMRWALEVYNKEREKEYDAIRKILEKEFDGRKISDTDIEKTKYWQEQFDILPDGADYKIKKTVKTNLETYKKDLTKYKLWREQECRCIYTGEVINLSDLFDDNKVDIEHTIPRSLSFDNSQANLTVCKSYFNRSIKQNRIPFHLENYADIMLRIRPWIDKVERIKQQVEFWRTAAKMAGDIERKKQCIRQRHLWEMELDYWGNKVERFKMQEVPIGFRNSQLVDTSIISKYAYHYLKTVFEHVEVQKGSITADFRKMLGVQSVDKKKNRSKHSHHAIDACVLTLIPMSSLRDKMLQLFYEIQEDKRLGRETKQKQEELRKYVQRCNLHKISVLPSFIEQNILVNHIVKDQTLTLAKRKVRSRGKEVFFDGKNRWKQGNCIRGQLHGETFYGAIKRYQYENGRLKKDKQGNPCVGEIEYVIRKELKYKKNDSDSGFKSWDELEKVIVDKALYRMMRGQFETGVTFEDACRRGFYMLNSKCECINKIRHIRCKSKDNTPIEIKRQTYLSNKEYKQFYYATNGENLYYAIYWDGIDKDRGFDCISLMDLAHTKPKEKRWDLLFSAYKTVKKNKKIVEFPFYAMLQAGTRVLMFNPDEFANQLLHINDYKQSISQMEHANLMRRLYVMTKMYAKDGRLQFKYHLEARDDKQLSEDFPVEKYGQRGKNGFSKFDFAIEQPKLLLSPGNFYFLIEGKDFIIEDNKIVFKNI